MIRLLIAVAALAALTGCAVMPKFGFHYDFINKRFTVTAEPGDGKTVQ